MISLLIKYFFLFYIYHLLAHKNSEWIFFSFMKVFRKHAIYEDWNIIK